MKKLILFFSFFLEIFAFDINIEIVDIRNTSGHIMIEVYNKKEGYLDEDESIKKITLDIENTHLKYTLKNINEGIYSIVLFHDENSNYKFDINFFGIPTEGIGVSNNVVPEFSAPTYKASSFKVKDNISMKIEMIY